jgi:hypothetical protein
MVPLLCNGHEIDGNTRLVSGQRLGKHVPGVVYAVRAEDL